MGKHDRDRADEYYQEMHGQTWLEHVCSEIREASEEINNGGMEQ